MIRRAGRLRQRTQSLPGKIAIERLDVTDQASIDAALGTALERFGHIDVLVNNAGVGVIGAMEVLDASTLRGIFDTTCLAPPQSPVRSYRRCANGKPAGSSS